MEKLEVGEYVRLKNGLIGQFYNIEEGYDGNIIVNFEEFGYEYEDIEQFYNDIKLHSKIISEVVEVGDYVNGKYVDKIKQYKDGKALLTLIGIIMEDDIKTILTKEQHMQNCYKVEEK